jgi:hypothetical protein
VETSNSKTRRTSRLRHSRSGSTDLCEYSSSLLLMCVLYMMDIWAALYTTVTLHLWRFWVSRADEMKCRVGWRYPNSDVMLHDFLLDSLFGLRPMCFDLTSDL